MAKLQIDESRLVAIGDALRVHFGAVKKEGHRDFMTESPKTILTGGTVKCQGETKLWVVQDVQPNEDDGGSVIIPVINNPYKLRTFYIPEADHITLDMTYLTNVSSNKITETTYADYIWVAEGRHSNVNEQEGKKYIYTKNQAWENPKEWWWTCTNPSCGYQMLGDAPLHPDIENWTGHPEGGGMIQATVCPKCNPISLVNHQNPNLMIKEKNNWQREQITIPVNEFTIAFKTYVETSYGGYYCDIYPYDADGNLLTSYEVIVDEIPNDYSVAQMSTAISKLNNYPNGEEEHF